MPLLQTELAKGGWQAGERTIRRTLHRLGWVWKRPRFVHGALNAATGELVQLMRERSRQDDCLAFVEVLGQIRPDVPKLLIWDNAPPHHPTWVREAA